MTNAAQYLLSALQAVGIPGHFDGPYATELVSIDAGPGAQIWVTDHDATVDFGLDEHNGWLACYYPDLEGQGSGEFTVIYSSDSASIEEDTPKLIKAIQAALNGQLGEPGSAIGEGVTS
ncbi:hypothetical protein ACFYOD_06610 [Streptomyces sp. NPDC006703]|uniref:hypothetical protein n=1 Tax=Streptomyces sp. NPDC006703 TaxID=3364759 RepID=UPI0036AD4A29